MFLGCLPCCGRCIDYDKYTFFTIAATAHLSHNSYNFGDEGNGQSGNPLDYTFSGINAEIPIVAAFTKKDFTVDSIGARRVSYFQPFSYNAGTRNDEYDGSGDDINVSLVGDLVLSFFGRPETDTVLGAYEIGLSIRYFPGFPGSGRIAAGPSASFDVRRPLAFTHYPCGVNGTQPSENLVLSPHNIGSSITPVSQVLDGSELPPPVAVANGFSAAPSYARPDLLIEGDPIVLTRSHSFEASPVQGGTVNVDISLSVETAVGETEDGAFEPLAPYWFGEDRVLTP